MKRTAVLMAVVLAIAGCGGSGGSAKEDELQRKLDSASSELAQVRNTSNGDATGTDNASDGGGSRATATTTKSSTTTTTTAPENPGIGATQKTSTGNSEATLVQVVDPATSESQYLSPKPGNRFVAVQLRFVNISGQTTQGSPTFETTLVDDQGQRYSSTYSPIQGCQAFAGAGQLAPGETVLGCIAFEVPEGAHILSVKYGSQFSDQAPISWTVG